MVLVMLQQNWMDYGRSHQSTYTIRRYQVSAADHSEEKWWKSGSEVLGLVVIE